MPVNKDALGRYRIIDRLLSDPNHNYTTKEICKRVNGECPETVTLRMIQKDIKSLEEEFGKQMIRNAGRRGTVKYKDQSEPLFYQELTSDEEEILREIIYTLGQFEGLDNFTWLDLLKKKLDIKCEQKESPIISFGVNNILQIPKTLLCRLFTAISRKKTIRIKYTPFSQDTKVYDVYPYQLRQFNNRWFLILNTVGNKQHPYKADKFFSFALDRMDENFEYLDDVPYIPSTIDLQTRFDEIVGITLLDDEDTEYIYFAVSPHFVDYIKTKWIHPTQMELEGEELIDYRSMYPSLNDWSFFSIECRANSELYSLFTSFGENLIVLSPTRIRDNMAKKLQESAKNYSNIIK